MAFHRVVLLLGSNLGDRTAILSATRELITTLIGSITLASQEYTTKPEGAFAASSDAKEPPSFLNQALSVETTLSPEAVLDTISKIERSLGRAEHSTDYTTTDQRLYHNRTIDIDIMFHDDQVIDTECLTVPHPRLHERLFVLEPLTEIMPEYIHPRLKIRLKELFNLLLLGGSQ